ncbi:MAG: hypothetical protein EHM48_00590 [Planctomycetaceae bacterium]|nr:MAG: hypothetical protein EHM48_00590 [Planctomycetaceae bacterium]
MQSHDNDHNRCRELKLYEAILWEPPNGYFLLERHLQRLERSSQHFRFATDIEAIRRYLAEYEHELPQTPRKVRMEVDRSGTIILHNEAVKPSTTVEAAICEFPVSSTDEYLRHKTTQRDVYDLALATHPEAQDVLLWNERHELTETCHGNIIVTIRGRKLTPPLSSGLLPGVQRSALLDSGEIEEGVVSLESLRNADDLELINSVRKRCKIRLLPRK